MVTFDPKIRIEVICNQIYPHLLNCHQAGNCNAMKRFEYLTLKAYEIAGDCKELITMIDDSYDHYLPYFLDDNLR